MPTDVVAAGAQSPCRGPTAMCAARGAEADVLARSLSKLNSAVARDASPGWQLRLWSAFIRARDGHRCVNCGSTAGVNAHHIVRKVLYPWGAVEPGNGISLCRQCHKKVHAAFNRRPLLTVPLGARNGDDQDEWAYLFGILLDDALERGLDPDRFYSIGDHMLQFFAKAQGYDDLLASVDAGELSRLRFAHEIWTTMPQDYYVDLSTSILELLLQADGAAGP